MFFCAAASDTSQFCFVPSPASSHLFASPYDSDRPAAIFGSTLGGFAAGWLWTAQGAYFTRTAKLYAKAKDIELVEATGWLGGIFATAYVGGEVLCKVASSALHLIGNDAFVYSVFTIVAVVSAGACAFIKDMPEEEKSIEQLEKEKAVEAGGVSRKVMLAVDLLRKDRKMQLLAPMNMTFGFTAAFINYFVNGTPVKAAIGESNIGYMAAVTPGIATLLSIPFSYLTKKIGKLPAMVFGASCYLSIAVSVGFMSENTLEGLGWGIVYVYILGGCGRSIFEGTNKATFSDFFPNDTEAAFANVGFFSGGAPALAFFIFPYLSKTAMSLTVALTGVVAVVCLFFAFRIHEQEKAEREAGYPAATMMGFPGVYEDKSDLEKQNEYEHGFGYEKAEDHTRRRHN